MATVGVKGLVNKLAAQKLNGWMPMKNANTYNVLDVIIVIIKTKVKYTTYRIQENGANGEINLLGLRVSESCGLEVLIILMFYLNDNGLMHTERKNTIWHV